MIGDEMAKIDDRVREIYDLALVSFLNIQGHSLLKIKRDNGRAIFIFAESPALEKDMLDFYNRKARVDPMTFAETLRNLRAAAKRI